MNGSKTVWLLGIVMLAIPPGWSVSASPLREQASFLRHTANGPVVVQAQGLPAGRRAQTLTDPWVVWSHHLADAIYNTTSNTVDGYVLAGTYLNPPEEAELFAVDGGGIPEWGYAGTEFFTDAGDGAFTLAAVDEDAAGVNVIKWTGPGSGIPDWTNTFAGYGVTSYGPIAVSDDGSTIAVIAAPATDAHLLLFDAGSATPLANYVASGLGFPRSVKINTDGRYTPFIASATIVVYDRDLLDVRDQIPMGFSNSALDISGDGNLIAYGWPSLRVMEWNGLSYQEVWSWSPGGVYYLNRVAISTDGATIVSCWYTTSHNTLKVVVHNAGSSAPLWTHDYAYSSGVYQEGSSDVDITDDGSYFIVGSYGDADNLNPEVHMFQRDGTPHVYYTVDMPGSVLSVDISKDGSYATACGKHVHINEMGRGGDIVMIGTGLTGVRSTDVCDLPSQSVLISSHPNPFSRTTTIRYSLRGSRGAEGQRGGGSHIPNRTSHITLSIYDLAGRLVRTLVNEPTSSFGFSSGGEFASGEPVSVSWDGRDHAGVRLSDGAYFLRLEAGEHSATRRLVIVR